MFSYAGDSFLTMDQLIGELRNGVKYNLYINDKITSEHEDQIMRIFTDHKIEVQIRKRAESLLGVQGYRSSNKILTHDAFGNLLVK
jgi:hypothetical protein